MVVFRGSAAVAASRNNAARTAGENTQVDVLLFPAAFFVISAN